MEGEQVKARYRAGAMKNTEKSQLVECLTRLDVAVVEPPGECDDRS